MNGVNIGICLILMCLGLLVIKKFYPDNKFLSFKEIKSVLKYMCVLASALVMFMLVTNLLMIQGYKNKIASDLQLKQMNADCILILGAGLDSDDEPSPMLKDRLNEGIRLYKAGVHSKFIVSGDHGQVNYDEVNAMKKYLIVAGIPSQNIFMDHAGFTTYESMYRAKDIFGIKKAIIVTHKYHLYRALYICDSLGIEARGSDANMYVDYESYREMFAREKAIITCLFKPKPKFSGEKIDIRGNGDVTND